MTTIIILYWLTVAAICAGIWHEEKLVRIERGVRAGIRKTIEDWRAAR